MSWCGARTARAGFKYPSFSLPYGTTIDAWVILSPHLRPYWVRNNNSVQKWTIYDR